ncbi:hypothetical protein P4S64_23165 [Vibrio sp. M60_M31a]
MAKLAFTLKTWATCHYRYEQSLLCLASGGVYFGDVEPYTATTLQPTAAATMH